MKKKGFIATIIGLIIIQFFPISKESQSIDSSLDFIITQPDLSETEVTLLKTSCMDCHSYETSFPGYTRWQPIGWWTRGHVRGGRKKLNFSEWNNYSNEDKVFIARKCIEVLEEGRMPLKSYTWMHEGSALTQQSQEQLKTLFQRYK